MGRSSERPNDSTLRGILDGALASNRRSRTEVALRFSFKPTRSPRIPLADRCARGALSVLARWRTFGLATCELSRAARVPKYASPCFRPNRTRQSPCSLRRFRLRYEWLLLLDAARAFFFRNFNGQGPMLVASGRWSTLEGPISKELTCSINL